ncbi:MAG: prepilin-type N-terminal cleavage/methylation domain-containing protein [Desulfobacterales bacterium]|jgi:general secretion pathway protein I
MTGIPTQSRLSQRNNRLNGSNGHNRLNGLNGLNRPNGQGGFTLIEMMVAVSIIAIVLTAVYRLHSQTLLMTIGARFYTVAPLLAQNKLVDIELSSAQELAQGTGNFGKDFPDYTWEVTIDDVSSDQLKTDSEQLKGAVEKLKRIDIKVLFNEGEMAYNLRTYRFIAK